MEDEIKRAYSLINSNFSKGEDFIIALAILDCEIYEKNQKHIIRTIRRNDEFEVLIGIDNPDLI